MMLLLPAREMIDGPTPIHLIEAATPGTGKSLVVQALLSPLLGAPPFMRSEPKDDAEWAKVIASAMLEGERLFVVDNINQALMSGTLSNAAVSYRFSTRALGYNKNIKGEIKWIWVMTGNNVKASMEVARRIVRTRIIAPAERPWEREQEKFHTPKLMQWVDRNSDLVCWAALTLVQTWIAAGMKGGKANLGSFEHWAEVMSGILECINVKGFLANANESFDDIADETATWNDFVKAWWSQHTNAPHPAKDLYDLLAINAIDLGLHGDNDSARVMSLSKMLGTQKDKVFDGFRIMRGKGSDRRKWYLEKIS
jgi:putative DNA primase/helicase